MDKFYANLSSVDFKELAFSLNASMSDFFHSDDFIKGFFTFKIIAAAFSVLFFVFIITILIKINGLREKSEKKSKSFIPDTEEFNKKWSGVLEKSQSTRVNDQKLSLIEADKMLDDVLKRMGYAGESMGERLKQLSGAQLPNIENVWEAHKIRNRIVHNSSYEPNKRDLDFAMRAYETALRDLKA